MSRTFRRKIVPLSIAKSYMMTSYKALSSKFAMFYYLKYGQTFEEIQNRFNFRFFSDNFHSLGAPRYFRNYIHRTERRKVKSQIIRAFRDNLEEELVDFRAKLPYWD